MSNLEKSEILEIVQKLEELRARFLPGNKCQTESDYYQPIINTLLERIKK